MVTSNVNMEILDSFNKAGIDFAFPTRTIYVEKDELADLAKEKIVRTLYPQITPLI